jgi:hypothetical protein
LSNLLPNSIIIDQNIYKLDIVYYSNEYIIYYFWRDKNRKNILKNKIFRGLNLDNLVIDVFFWMNLNLVYKNI